MSRGTKSRSPGPGSPPLAYAQLPSCERTAGVLTKLAEIISPIVGQPILAAAGFQPALPPEGAVQGSLKLSGMSILWGGRPRPLGAPRLRLCAQTLGCFWRAGLPPEDAVPGSLKLFGMSILWGGRPRPLGAPWLRLCAQTLGCFWRAGLLTGGDAPKWPECNGWSPRLRLPSYTNASLE